MAPEKTDIPDTVRSAVLSFNVDLVTVEVTEALRAASIPSILLKGPAVTTWLYAGEHPRLYSDTDLLVRREDWKGAIGVLQELGFEDDLAPLAHPRMESGGGHLWVRPADGAEVDLHFTLFGIGADPDELFEAFADGSRRERLGGGEVQTPGYPARLLHIALHAVQHGGEAQPKPMMDLERAVARAPRADWLRALALAQRLEAGESFAAGLRLTPAGRELATAIGAGRGHSPGAYLRLGGVPLAEGFQQFAEARGFRRKLALVARELFPSRAFMRWWSPLVRRGPLGLVAGYAWRLVWLLYRAPRGYMAWRRAVRASENG